MLFPSKIYHTLEIVLISPFSFNTIKTLLALKKKTFEARHSFITTSFLQVILLHTVG